MGDEILRQKKHRKLGKHELKTTFYLNNSTRNQLPTKTEQKSAHPPLLTHLWKWVSSLKENTHTHACSPEQPVLIPDSGCRLHPPLKWACAMELVLKCRGRGQRSECSCRLVPIRQDALASRQLHCLVSSYQLPCRDTKPGSLLPLPPPPKMLRSL